MVAMHAQLVLNVLVGKYLLAQQMRNYLSKKVGGQRQEKKERVPKVQNVEVRKRFHLNAMQNMILVKKTKKVAYAGNKKKHMVSFTINVEYVGIYIHVNFQTLALVQQLNLQEVRKKYGAGSKEYRAALQNYAKVEKKTVHM